MKPGENRIPCPHCNGPCRTLKTKQIAPTYREITLMCMDDDCGHTFVASLTPVRTITPSATPNPEIRIPGTARAD